MNTMHAIKTHPLSPQPTPSLGAGVATTTVVAGLARFLMKEGMEAPRQFFTRINGTLARPGTKRITRRVERTATEILYFLFRCHVADRAPSVSDVYLSTGLARGTAIRCIASLRELGVLETSIDLHDRRRSRVRFAKSYQRLIAEFSDSHCQRLDEQLAASGFVHAKHRLT